MPLAVGEVFAGYTVVRKLGAGGMGSVYLVQHPRLPRQDALKVLTPELSTNPQYRARFLREADLVAALSHPNILAIHDRGEYDGQLWIAMDYVAGTDAASLLREHYPHGMPPAEVLDILTPVASALDYAHEQGYLHRDVKPANILLAEPDSGGQRRIFLADFGIARRVDDTAGLTATNMAVGTVAYAAPEQLLGEHVDGRADQYALACTAFQLLTGSHPYDYSSAAVVITKHVTAPPPSIGEKRPELAALDPVFATAMAKKPDDRYPSCEQFIEELRRALTFGSSDLEATQLAPATGEKTRSAPTRAAELPPPPLKPGPRRWLRRPAILVPALLAIVVLAAGGIVAAVKLSHTTPPASQADTGPFTGVYRADFAPEVDLAGQLLDGGATTTGTFDVRSLCRSTGCVATANRKDGPTLQPTLVFDKVGESWLSVAVIASTPPTSASLAPGFRKNCQEGAPLTGEIWEVFSLQSNPDGTLAGEYTARSSNRCDTKRSVTFTRVADVDINAVPDPANQAPRVVSPAEALHGRYHSTETSRSEGVTYTSEGDGDVRTDCLRSGERCMSYIGFDDGEVTPLVFADGLWTENTEFDVSWACSSGGSLHVRVSATYPLPQPQQDPITLLTGHRREERSPGTACVTDYDGTFDFDRKFERTGD